MENQHKGFMMSKDFKQNTNYEVLTPDGFKDFSGVSNMGTKPVWRVETKNGLFLECTHDHKIFVNGDDRVPLNKLNIGDEIFTHTGFDPITKIANTGRVEDVYDLIEVEGGHKYYANGILSSNCEFISFEETLIASAKIARLESKTPIRKTGQVRWYEPIDTNCTYVVGLDPAMGTGGDNAAIQVYELPSLKQVAEWCSNRTPVERQVAILREITHEIEGAGAEVYWSVENNTLGEAALVVIRDTGEENFAGAMLHDPQNKSGTRRKGFLTTNKSKLEACSILKRLIEGAKLKISSRALISELKTFVARGNTYEARPGTTDDLVMSTILCLRIMQFVSSWDDNSQDAMNTSIYSDPHNSEDDFDSPMPVFV